MFEEWNKALLDAIKNGKTTKSDIKSQDTQETFKNLQHSMLIERSKLEVVYSSLEDLTFADLCDYQNIERCYGRNNKTR